MTVWGLLALVIELPHWAVQGLRSVVWGVGCLYAVLLIFAWTHRKHDGQQVLVRPSTWKRLTFHLAQWAHKLRGVLLDPSEMARGLERGLVADRDDFVNHATVEHRRTNRRRSLESYAVPADGRIAPPSFPAPPRRCASWAGAASARGRRR